MNAAERQQVRELFLARIAALSSPADPLWAGLLATVQQMREDSVDSSCRPDMTADARAYNAGRVSMAADILQALSDAWDQSHR